jgi:hypothetical protein
MAYNTPYTFIALQALTSSQMNGIQDNIRALWPYTTTGDISYASAADTLARLGKGTYGQKLFQGTSAPFWYTYLGCNLTLVAQSINNNTLTDITTSIDEVDAGNYHESTNGYVTIPINMGGLYILGCSGYWDAHATATKSRELYININNGTGYIGQTNANDDGNTTFHQNICTYIYLSAGDTVRVSVRQKSGGALTFTTHRFWCIRA